MITLETIDADFVHEFSQGGVFQDIDIEAYHRALGGYSKSNLDAAEISPANLVAQRARPAADSEALLIGRALHTRIEFMNDKERFETLFPTLPIFEGSGSRKAKKEFLELNAGKKFLTESQRELVEGMFEGLLLNPQTADLVVAHGAIEESYSWVDPDSGLLLKTRPDKRILQGHSYLPENLLIDWKTIDRIENIQDSIYERRYHVQDAMGTDGVSQVLGSSVEEFWFVFVEKAADHRALVVEIPPEDRELGRSIYKHQAKVLKDCELNGVWPGYVQRGIPKWARERQMAMYGLLT